MSFKVNHRMSFRLGSRPLNILTAPTHERYESHLAQTGHDFFAIRVPGILKDWNSTFAPVPANYGLLDPTKKPVPASEDPLVNLVQQLPAGIKFDLVLSQNRFGQFQLLSSLAKYLNVPLISLEHTLPMSFWSKKKMGELKQMKGDVNVFISEYSRGQWGFDGIGEVIHHGLDTDKFFNEEEDRGPYALSVCNDWINRSYCMPAGQRILTENGYVKIEDIKIGNKVLTDSGEYHHVTKVFSRDFNGVMMHFRLDKNQSMVSFTGNHGIRVFRNNQWQYVAASRIKPGDKLKFPKIVRKDWTCSDEDFAWLIGLILGDGSITDEGNITICLHEDEMDFAERARKILEGYTGYATISHRRRARLHPIKAVTVEATSKVFAIWLKSLIGSKMFEKHVPDFIFFGSDRLKAACIQGMFDSDGYMRKNRNNLDVVEYASISLRMASQYMAMATHLGIKCSFSKKVKSKKKGNGVPLFIYNVRSYGQDNVEKFSNITTKPDESPYSFTVSEVVQEDEWAGKVYNCEVADNHSYVVDPGFVVHNCCGYKLWEGMVREGKFPVRVVGDTPGLSNAAASVADLVGEYNRASVFLNTSLISPVPTALLEAMACGCAPVTTNTCMIPEVIQHGVNGYLFDPQKPQDGIALVKELLANPTKAREMGKAARQTVLDKFSLRSFLNNWNTLFDKVAAL